MLRTFCGFESYTAHHSFQSGAGPFASPVVRKLAENTRVGTALCTGTLVVALGLIHASAAAAQEARNVLVVFSNARLLPANIELERGLRETFAKSSDRRMELFAEFLDVPHFGGPAYSDTMATYLREKYAARPPDAIVVAAEDALEFVLRHRDQLFPQTPVVHVAVSRSYLRKMPALPPDVVGVPIEWDFSSTIEQALAWHPKARRLIVVTGASAWDRDWETQLRTEASTFAGRATPEFLAGLPTGAVLERLRALGGDAIVFSPGYFEDGDGRVFIPRDSIELIASAATAPVYAPYDSFLGSGVVGGRMPTFRGMGREAAGIVTEILAGAVPSSLRLPELASTELHLDWRQARRWGIAERDVPAGAVWHFRELTFWQAHRTTAIVAIVTFLLQAGLIAALLVERRLRRRTATALEESEGRMTLAARAAELSMWIWDAAGDRVWNTGSSRGQASGLRQALEAVHPADREGVEQAVRRAVADGTDLDIEYRRVGPDGEVRWVVARGGREKGDGRRLLGVTLDITARKRAELQAERDRTSLRHMTRVSMLGQISASIAHQMNQPLAAILGNAEAVQKMLGREPVDLAELRAICDDIVSEDLRAVEVIRHLRALFRRGELTPEPVDLNKLVRETLELVRVDLEIRHVSVVSDLAASLPIIDGGPIQLQQVLLNLVLNAADAMGEMDEKDRVITVRTELVGASAAVSVADRGPGIAPENLKRVFDPFWSTTPGGMGIGLAVCQSIVAAHQRIPGGIQQPWGRRDVSRNLPAARRRMSADAATETVFVVDDDAGVLKALSRLLRAEGWRVETFESAEAFLERRGPETPGCLLLDVNLPGIDGLELQRRLAEAVSALPIVFMTGHGDIPMSVRAIKAGATDFLTKPVRAAALVVAVRSAIDQDAAARQAAKDTAELRRRLSQLTPRERAVLDGVVAGRLNKQIANDLGIVEQTVKFHRAHLMERMQARTAAELMIIAARLGIGTKPRS